MKDYKSNIAFFKRWAGLKTLGLGMVIVGFVCVWALWEFFFIGMILLALGVVAFLVGNIGLSTEEDIMNEIKRGCTEYEYPEFENDRAFHGRVPQNAQKVVFSGFDYKDGMLFKKMKNGSIASSGYTYAEMWRLSDALYFKSRTFSLISDEKDEKTIEIPASSIKSISVERQSATFAMKKKSFPVKLCAFTVEWEGGKAAFPCNDDITMDDLAEKIRKEYSIG